VIQIDTAEEMAAYLAGLNRGLGDGRLRLRDAKELEGSDRFRVEGYEEGQRRALRERVEAER
jgi:hypothetical protein